MTKFLNVYWFETTSNRASSTCSWPHWQGLNSPTPAKILYQKLGTHFKNTLSTELANTPLKLLPNYTELKKWNCRYTYFNRLRPRQNGRHFADDIFKCIFLNENVWIPIKISLKFVPQGPINNIPALVQKMAWRRPGDKPSSGPMMVRLPTHICVTRPQWVNCHCNYCTATAYRPQRVSIPLSKTSISPDESCTRIALCAVSLWLGNRRVEFTHNFQSYFIWEIIW